MDFTQRFFITMAMTGFVLLIAAIVWSMLM
jgi:hypothetical protein